MHLDELTWEWEWHDAHAIIAKQKQTFQNLTNLNLRNGKFLYFSTTYFSMMSVYLLRLK